MAQCPEQPSVDYRSDRFSKISSESSPTAGYVYTRSIPQEDSDSPVVDPSARWLGLDACHLESSDAWMIWVLRSD